MKYPNLPYPISLCSITLDGTTFDLLFEEKPVSKQIEMRVSGALFTPKFSKVVDNLCFLSENGFDGKSNGNYVFQFDINLPIKYML